MQSGKHGPRLFDDLARIASGAAGAASGLRDEMEGLIRERVDRVVDDLDLARREDVEVVRAMAQRAREMQEDGADQAERLARIESELQRLMGEVRDIQHRLTALERGRTGDSEAPSNG